jgi:hypothetical protein
MGMSKNKYKSLEWLEVSPKFAGNKLGAATIYIKNVFKKPKEIMGGTMCIKELLNAL